MAIIMRVMIFCLALLSNAAFCLAETEKVLTWEDCVNQAIMHNPDLASAKEKVRQAREDKYIALSDILPQVSSQAGASRTKAAKGKETEAYSYNLSAQQLVFDGYKTASGVAEASKTMTAEEYNLAVTSSNIRLNLREAFVNLLRAEELISLTADIAGRRKENLELVQLRYEAGREHKGALLTAEADLAQAEFEAAQAERNLLLSEERLSKELGGTMRPPIRAKGAFEIKEPQDEKPFFESLANETPFLKELIARKEAARFHHNSSQADFFPQVYLNGSWGHSASDWPPRHNAWSMGMTVSLPIFEGGKRVAEVSKTGSQLREAEANEISGRESVIFTLESAWKNFQDSIGTVFVKQKFLQATEERAKIAVAQYSTGLATFDDWIIIEDNLVNARKAYLDAQANLLLAEAAWIQAKGGTLENVKE
ncbi:MAG: TolC family protein [Candidatus Omnitrophica bacterium]|nr:TolC family protein [Candidatus Omnitrophota bacterium]